MPEYTDVLETLFAQASTTRPVLDQIAAKWSIMILSVVCTKPSRFNAIKRHLPGITHKALTEALRRLQRNGLIARRVVSSTPVAVEYSITPLGQTLQTPYAALYAWAVAHQAEVQAAQQRYDCEASASPCGAPIPGCASSCTLG
jgi:DNA-binding HxlR family transcriptional regulator